MGQVVIVVQIPIQVLDHIEVNPQLQALDQYLVVVDTMEGIQIHLDIWDTGWE